MVLEGLYSLLLGIFLTFFVGIGINTFYAQPIYHEPASCMAPLQKDGAPSISQEQCQKEINANQNRTNTYSQNVSLIALVAAVIYVAIGFLVFRSTQLFSSGFLFGSIFTLLYSLARGLNSNNHVFAFIIVTISIILVMAIGYLRFVRVSSKTTK
jgi:hypothetical protein